MDFNTDKPIYLQIVEYVYERILQQEWPEDTKILSVRDLGAELEVNPNTVMRSYEKLQNDNIIYNKRGIGFFVVKDASILIKKLRVESFKANELVQALHTAKLLGISEQEIVTLYKHA
ncbi:GntR family transcriptional regulator [Sphingobacterium rhinopitheci]|uniref:GntR family transcriptional regulator n=1 Tax=Sphingobacterium rhinopitheci TaxID=2781960 RepID=UPI001F527270|nr:GntR family transcriptional regulator [Sphingobacterium rhinopitheci]MCI0921693.1 GntR family transcriptional regulator [Sphingobacterium rhinopitheci]